MGVELAAIASLGITTLGAIFKLYRHLDQRLDILQVDRASLRADFRLLEYRIDRLESRAKGEP